MPLTTRYALTILLVIVISVTAVASATLLRVRQILDEAQEQSKSEMTAALEAQLQEFGIGMAEQLASVLAEPVYHFELDEVLDLLSPVIAQDSVIEAHVFDPEGIVIHDGTDTMSDYGRNINDHLAVRVALADRVASAQLDGDYLDVAAPIQVGKQIMGGVHLHLSAVAVRARITDMGQTLQIIRDDGIAGFIKVTVLLLISLSALGLIVAYLLARGMAQPIRALSAMARRIGQGDYSAAVTIDRTDEIGDLGRSFQQMASDLRTAHDQLARAKDEADRANAQKSQFLANMSHEIRTPMNGVLGMTDLLMRTELSGRQTRFVKAVRKSAQGLLNIINDILDFSRIEAGKVALDLAPSFDLHELVADVVDLTAETSEANKLHIAGMLDEGVPRFVSGDPNRLRQVLLNLIGNAIKFTAEGEVVVRVRPDKAGRADRLHFEVSDTGIGIEPATTAKLFAAFEQADGSITRRFGGTGLGLTISAQLIDLMGGEIGVDSTPGEGSTFWFTARLPEADAPRANDGASRNLAGLRILVADSNATSTNIIASAIRGWNGHPETVGNGAEAIERLKVAQSKGGPFDLAIVDINLADINAVQLAERIHSVPALSSLPIVVMTSFGWEGDGTQAKAAGIHGMVTKPVRQTELFAEIAAVLGPKLLIAPPLDAPLTANDENAGTTSFKRRILLAEDNPVNQEVAKEFLAALGCECQLAVDGREAVAKFDQGGFDAILMDCQMPEMDGFAAARQIRQREREDGTAQPVPIIAVTANAFESDRQLCFDAGMTDYLSKPFNQNELEEALWRAFGGRQDEAKTEKETSMRDANDNAAAEGPLDPAALDALAAATPNDPGSLVKKVIGLYLEHAPGLVTGIRRALEDGDCDAAREAAHSLKSSSANVGAMTLSSQCKALEMAAREGAVGEPDAVADEIDEEFAAVCGALQTELLERTKGAA